MVLVLALLAGCAATPIEGSKPGTASVPGSGTPGPSANGTTGGVGLPLRGPTPNTTAVVRPAVPPPAKPVAAPGAAAAAQSPPAAAPGSLPPFAAVIKDARQISGPITAWQKDEKLWLELAPEHFDRPFILSPKLSTGIGEALILGGLMA